MASDPAFSAANTRPDLEEFLGALSGFLNKETASQDPSYFKFLGIFCRSIGAAKGHFLKKNDQGTLDSVLSFGMGEDFDQAYNKGSKSDPKPGPLRLALQKKEVIAIVDLDKDPDVPPWFMKIMKEKKFCSLVAVPLMGRKEPTGVLCAYYHDVCLFDQGTLDHLMMIGRMVGAATEEPSIASSSLETLEPLDNLLGTIITNSVTKTQVYTQLMKAAQAALRIDGAAAGALQKSGNDIGLAVSANKKLLLPAFLKEQLLKGGAPSARPVSEWGEFKSVLNGPTASGLLRPLVWRKKIIGAIVVWRKGNQAFQAQEASSLDRLCHVASLGLNVKES